MNSIMMNEISTGMITILNNTSEGKNTRNALYDLTLLHKSAVDAQAAFSSLVKNPSDLYLFIPYSSASVSFISIPRWMYESAEDHEVSSNNRAKLKNIEKVFKLIRKMEEPIIDGNKMDQALAEKILALWHYIENEVLAIWVETVRAWNISTQMSCFVKDNCLSYVGNLIESNGQLSTVSHFVNLYYRAA